MAIGIFSFARSYRIEILLMQLERETIMLETAVSRDGDMSIPETRRWFDRMVAATGVDVVLFDLERRALYLSDRDLASVVGPALEDAESRGVGRIRPRQSHQEYLAVVRPATVPGWPDVAYVGMASGVAGLERDLASLGIWLTLMVVTIIVVVLLISYRVVDTINTPLRYLQTAAKRFADGDLDYRCVLPEPLEFNRLADTMNSMASQLTARIDAIRSQRRQLEAILGSMVEGVILVDAQYRIQSMNAAARRLFAVDRLVTPTGEARTLLEVIRNSELYDLVRRTFSEENQQEARIVVYSSPIKHMQVHGTSLEIGEEPHVLIVMNDISRLHQLEQIRKEFVANVSHELKTPITSILGFVETLSEGALADPDEASRFLDIIANQSHRLNTIIEDLLQLSRLEQNREAIPRTGARAEEIVGRVKAALEHRAEEKAITLVDGYRGATDIIVAENLLEQALTNLVDNAIKYCPRGTTVHIDYVRTGSDAVFAVRDSGPGIPEADQPRLFERFFRVDKARSRALGGTGLGLAIVKHIAQAHEGHVEVDSAPGRGSTFRLVIPQE